MEAAATTKSRYMKAAILKPLSILSYPIVLSFPLKYLMLINTRILLDVAGPIRWFHITIHIQVSSDDIGGGYDRSCSFL